MAVEGGMKCVKFLLFIFNFLFWICGIALIVIGILVQMTLHKTLLITNASASGAPIVIIAVGVVIFFIAFFGCCGAWKESYCMITTFAVLLTLIFLVEIAAAIAGYIFKDKVKDVFSTAMEDSMKKYNQSADFKKAVDTIQTDFHCCGSHNYTDWFIYRANSTVPDSCCKTPTLNCGNNVTSSNINQPGCAVTIDTWIQKNLLIVVGVALGIAFFQLLGIVFACVLMKAIRSGYEVM